MHARHTHGKLDDGIVMPIDDARVPRIVREAGMGYVPAASFVVAVVGNEEFFLFSADGALLDFVWLKPAPTRAWASAFLVRLFSLPVSVLRRVLVFLLLLPPLLLLARAWRTESFDLLWAGLLALLVAALVFVIGWLNAHK